METSIIVLTLVAYGLAIWLWWREHAPNYLVALLAGHLGSLPSPLWQWLYNFSYNPQLIPLFTLLSRPLPRIIFVAAWTMMLPPLVVFFFYRHRWWFPGYVTGIITFVLFVVYHLLIENLGIRSGWWQYNAMTQLPLGLQVTVLAALMNGLISLGILSLLILTRRYGWLSLLLVLLPMPLVLSLFVHGLLGAPLYTVLLMRAQNWASVIGMLGTLGLLLWGAHIAASSIDGQRSSQQMI